MRQELASPIMATPFSQFVGIQAVLNVVTGERYKLIPDEVIRYAMGHYGPLIRDVDPAVMDKILDSPRARQFQGWVRPQPTLGEIRSKFTPGISDEELLMRFMTSDEEVDAMLAAGPIRTEPRRSENEIVRTIQDIARGASNVTSLSIAQSGWSLDACRNH